MHAGRDVYQFLSKSLAAGRKSLNTLAPLLVLALLMTPLFGGLSKAVAAEWVITRLSGTVYLVAPGIKAHRARKGMALHKGHTIATRRGARAVLQRGKDSIVVGPNTEFALSQYRSNDSKTTLLQRKGTIDVDVETRGMPFFRVETPYLAAVVKGTRFSVSVHGKESQVTVQRGVVGVQDLASGQRSDLRSGQSVQSAPDKFSGLKSVGKTRAAIQQGKPAKPTFGKVPTGPSSTGTNVQQNSSGGIFGTSSSANSGDRGSSGNTNGTSGSNSGANRNSGSGNAGSGNSSNSGGASAGASAGGTSANTSAGSGGANANVSAGGANANASVNGNGVNANVGGVGVSVGR